jgi:hypothetical protein
MSIQIIILDNSTYICGGTQGTDPSDQCFKYEFDTDTWDGICEIDLANYN